MHNINTYVAFYNGDGQQGRLILLNIALFIPLGFFLANIFNNSRICLNGRIAKEWLLPIGVGLFVTITIETIQFFEGLGLCDIDDIFSNLLGTALGVVICSGCESFKTVNKVQQWNLALSFILTIGGVAGCIVIGTAAPTHPNELMKQFDFDINNVVISGSNIMLTGYCCVYNCETPSYQIFLKGEDSRKIYKADTEYIGNTFNTIVPVNSTEKLEVIVKFKGFNPMNTVTYIHNDKVEYVSGETIVPEIQGTDLDWLVKTGILKAYVPENEVYVYQFNNVLYWLIGHPVDKRTEIIFHLHTNEPEKLPEHRKKYKFDNLGFRPGGKTEL